MYGVKKTQLEKMLEMVVRFKLTGKQQKTAWKIMMALNGKLHDNTTRY